MTDEPSVESADQGLERAYEMMNWAIEREGHMTDRVDSELDQMYETVQEELSGYREHVSEVSDAVEEAASGEELDVMDQLVSAGQHLVNAYSQATEMYNAGESVLENGEEGLDQDFLRVNMNDIADNIGLYNQAVGLKEDAFQQYDEVLQETASDVLEHQMETDMVGHVDIGLGQQRPEDY
jgi:uncharacterized phage infection (PIP) family protein YhgE